MELIVSRVNSYHRLELAVNEGDEDARICIVAVEPGGRVSG
jgi:hypothetical protein